MGRTIKNNLAEQAGLDASPSKSARVARAESSPARAASSLNLTTQQRAAADERLRLLKAALPLFEGHLPQCTVATLLGISPATLSRLLNLCPAKGNFARTALAKCRRLVALPASRLAPKAAGGPGPSSPFEPLLKVPAIVRELSQAFTGHRRAGCSVSLSIAIALEDLGYCAAVPPLLARKLRTGSQPKPLVDYLRKAPRA